MLMFLRKRSVLTIRVTEYDRGSWQWGALARGCGLGGTVGEIGHTPEHAISRCMASVRRVLEEKGNGL